VAVAARSIVKALDVIRHISGRQRAVFINLFLDPFFFQAAEK
jgi:hypothetical protein